MTYIQSWDPNFVSQMTWQFTCQHQIDYKEVIQLSHYPKIR